MTLLHLQRFSTPELTAIHEAPTTISTTGHGNRGCNSGRGGGRSRGRGQSSNNWQQHQANPYASPWYYHQPPLVYSPFTPYPVYPIYSPYNMPHQPRSRNTAHCGIVRSHPATPSHQTNMAQQAAPPKMTQIPAALNHTFNTMTF